MPNALQSVHRRAMASAFEAGDGGMTGPDPLGQIFLGQSELTPAESRAGRRLRTPPVERAPPGRRRRERAVYFLAKPARRLGSTIWRWSRFSVGPLCPSLASDRQMTYQT